MSSPRTPFEGLQELFERLSRQIETAARPIEGDIGTGGQFDVSLGTKDAGVDLADRDDEYVLTVDVPGYEREDLEVRLSGDRLSIRGERDRRDETELDGEYIRRERRSHSFDRSVRLPEAAEPEETKAEVRNGVLTVTLPKRDPDDRPRTIDIE